MPNEKRKVSYDSSTDERYSTSSLKHPRQDLSESESEPELDGTLKAQFLKRLHTKLTEEESLHQLHSHKSLIPTALSFCIEHTLQVLMDPNFQHQLTDHQLEYLKAIQTDDILAHVKGLSEKEITDLKDTYIGFLKTESNFDLGFLFQLSLPQENRRPRPNPPDTTIPKSLSTDATVKSWKGDYTGRAHESLWFHIETLCEEFTNDRVQYYAKYCSIVQSSGMGKSRLVDEISKTHFTIPLCLRCDPSGFPPADVHVRNYLTRAREETEANEIAQAFLTSLFMEATKWIDDNFPSKEVSIREVASKFRDYMNKDQKFEKPGEHRENFFRNVIDFAQKLRPTESRGRHDDSRDKKSGLVTPELKSMQVHAPGSADRIITWKHPTDSRHTSNITVVNAAKLLQNTLLKFEQDKWKSSSPIIILSFDEAHTLGTTVEATDVSTSSPTYFSCLRRALRKIRNQAIFSLFLSTTGQIFQFTPPRGLDSSARVTTYSGLSLMPPYTDLGYDMLAKHAVEGQTTIDDVTRIDYLVRLGRPLFATRYIFGVDELKKQIIIFAAQKLTKMDDLRAIEQNNIQHEEALLACLMFRLALDFNRWSYEGKKREMLHVENHMRVCLQAEPSFDGVHTISPSEPILAEGARLVMKTVPFNAASILANEYRHPEVERGPQGEAIVKLLMTLATDMVAKAGKPRAWSVPEFLQKLCGRPSSEGVLVCDVLEALPSCVHPKSGITLETRLQDAFKDSKMNMNHFVKAGDSDVLNRNFMWERIPRCAGVECPPNHPAIDLVIPITYYDEALGRYNVTFILIQVKNNIKYGSKVDTLLFDAMDPYLQDLFSTGDKDYSIGCIPIIRIVIALASNQPTVVNLCSQTPKRNTRQNKESGYTAYDFWFSGLNHHVWGPIKKEEEASWKRLLDASGRSIPKVFESKNTAAEELRRSQAPSMFNDRRHSCQFIQKNDELSPNMEIRGSKNHQ